MVSLTQQPPSGRRLLIIATTTQRAVLKQLDMYDSFDANILVPNVETYDELRFILEQTESFTPEEINRALQNIGGIVDDQRIGIGIKRILRGIENSKQYEDRVGRFARFISHAIDKENFPSSS